MDDELSHNPSNRRVDREDSFDETQDFTSVRCYISQSNSNSPDSDEPKGFPIAQHSPTKVKIYQEESTVDQPGNASIYVRPRVRISPEYEKSSLDEIDFSGDEADPVTPCTPARIDRRFIDTSAPIESVKDAGSKFGGTVDWKSHKSRSFEKRKNIDHELEKTQEEIPLVKQQTEAAEEAKTQVLNDLEATNQLIEELEMSLERAKSEEDEAKQGFELANSRVKDMEQGIADEARLAANNELEMAKSKHESALSELKCVKEELESLQKEYSSLLNEKEAASKKAEEAVAESKEVEKTLEELSKELVSTKELLESTQAEHMQAEEKRVEADLVSERETREWEKEMKKAEEEIEELKRQIDDEKDLKGKLNIASALLASLESELAAYRESSDDKNSNQMQAAVLKAKNELEEMKVGTENAIDEVKLLKATSTSLKNELECEKTNLRNLKQREGMASVAVASLEAELERIKSEIESVQMREKEAKEKTMNLPKQLQVASQEADEAKSAAKEAHEALRKAKEEAEQAKAGALTVESRLIATQKEIEASKASEKLALDSIRGLQETESTQRDESGDQTSDRVTISLEEYNELSKKAQEAEEKANEKVASALASIEAAKKDEERTLKKLEDMNRELATRKEVYKAASSKAEKASEAKLSVEQELRNWRAEHEQRRKVDYSPRKGKEGNDNSKGIEGNDNSKGIEQVAPPKIATSSKGSGRSDTSSPKFPDHGSLESSPDMKGGKKKKKSFFPRFFMFFNKKKHSSKT